MNRKAKPGRGQFVIALREKLGMNQRQFANACGLDRGLMSNIEHDRNKLSTLTMRNAIAMGAGLTLDALNAYLDDGASLESILGGQPRLGEAA